MQIFTPYFRLLISTAFVVVSRDGCLGVTGLQKEERGDINGTPVPHLPQAQPTFESISSGIIIINLFSVYLIDCTRIFMVVQNYSISTYSILFVHIHILIYLRL